MDWTSHMLSELLLKPGARSEWSHN